MRHIIALLLILLALIGVPSAASEPDTLGRDLLRETIATVEASATASTGQFAPLWLTANRYGLGSVRPSSAYLRASLQRDIINDSSRTWRFGYGLDLAVAYNHERTGILQQAYVEGAWKKIRLTIGAKQQPMETQNHELASGELMFGINARPIPQVRLDIDWFPFPWTRGWWQWRIFGSFGWMTDGRWQEGYVSEGQRYARHVRYHEKALYWLFGRKDIFPLTYEFGLRMATQFGGDCYNIQSQRVNDGAKANYHYNSGLKAYWQALTQQGSDNTDGSNPNVAGNTLGSYIMQLRYHGSTWQARAYWERFFEDHSMLTVQYGIRDMLIGGEVTVPRNPYLTTAVVEFMSSTDQTGPIFHDPTPNFPEKVAGRDNYYNHNLYAGWLNYGLPIGNPFITSPLYNDALGHSHVLHIYNNRVKAWHIALSGDPSPQWHWRAKASFTRNWGSYASPLPDILRQRYAMAELTFRPRPAAKGKPSSPNQPFSPTFKDQPSSPERPSTPTFKDQPSSPERPSSLDYPSTPTFKGKRHWASDLQISLALGLDHGDLIGNSFGAQLTISKALSLKP